MRTQAIAGLFDGREWHAESIDATGWIVEPATDKDSASSPPIGLSVGQQDATATREAAERRADAGREGRSRGRSVRRTRRVRHLRRVRTENLKSAAVIVDAPGRHGAGRRSPGRFDGPEVAVFSPPAVDPAATGSAAAEVTAEGYRLGRWARLALTVTALAAIVVVVVSLASGTTQQTMVDVTVAPGDTLWSIAAQAAPDRDPRDVIEEIRQLNDMQGGVLPIGVVLRVPATVG
jgi:LysM repeat protein